MVTTRGRGFSREGEGSIASGFSCSPRCQAANDKRERFANLWTPEGIVQQVFLLHLVGLQRREKEKKRKTWGKIITSEIQIWKLNPPNRSKN
jgi:hypothetical protein